MHYLVDCKILKSDASDECEIKGKKNTCKNTYEDSFVGTVLFFINVIIVLLALLTIPVISVAYLNRAINVDMKVMVGFYLCFVAILLITFCMTMHFQEKEEIKNFKNRKLNEFENLIAEISPLDNNLLDYEEIEETSCADGNKTPKKIIKRKNLNAELSKKIIDAISEV